MQSSLKLHFTYMNEEVGMIEHSKTCRLIIIITLKRYMTKGKLNF